MPLIAAFAYADNICYEQSQFDPFENCSSVDEALETYHKMVFSEHQYGVEIDPSDPDYFLEFVQEAEELQKAWASSSGQEDVFLELAKGLPGNCLELAETIVAGDYSDLCF
jgi:hypothetical protein